LSYEILAGEGRVWFDHDHVWHIGIADRMAAAGDNVVSRTQWRVVALDDGHAVSDAITWCEPIDPRL
jgi:PNKP (polynucleotide 5'-kinase/3'-phosphatase) family adenylyltransferase-like protein